MDEIKQGHHKFYIGETEEKNVAQLSYLPSGEDTFILTQTSVSSDLRGKGMGKALVKRMAEYAEEQDKKIIPDCPFAKGIMENNDEYENVLAK